MRHRDVPKHQVVPAGRKLVVALEVAPRRGRERSGAALGERSACDDEQDDADEPERGLHHVTLSGTGLVLSRAVYQGIRMKNRKYTSVSTRASHVARSLVSSA